MAVVCATVPLTRALRALQRSASGGTVVGSAEPRFSRCSGLHTQVKEREGSPPVFLNFCRSARASPSPTTLRNGLARIWKGSIFSAAPIEEKSVTEGSESAWRMSAAFSERESMASMT